MNLLLLLFIFLVLASVVFAALSFAPWVPTWKSDIKRAAKLLDLKPGQIFYDLGCGDGRVVFYFAKNEQARSRGIELAVPFFFIAKIRSYFVKNAEITFGDLFEQNVSDADGIFLFGTPKRLGPKMVDKLKKELKPGTKVISYVFPLMGVEPVLKEKPEKKNAIYLYKF